MCRPAFTWLKVVLPVGGRRDKERYVDGFVKVVNYGEVGRGQDHGATPY